jgi:hypothetical protein
MLVASSSPASEPGRGAGRPERPPHQQRDGQHGEQGGQRRQVGKAGEAPEAEPAGQQRRPQVVELRHDALRGGVIDPDAGEAGSRCVRRDRRDASRVQRGVGQRVGAGSGDGDAVHHVEAGVLIADAIGEAGEEQQPRDQRQPGHHDQAGRVEDDAGTAPSPPRDGQDHGAADDPHANSGREAVAPDVGKGQAGPGQQPEGEDEPDDQQLRTVHHRKPRIGHGGRCGGVR